jgi:nucleotide-binding universal stress UspA family protein
MRPNDAIIVGVNNTPGSYAALRFAAQEAKRRRTGVHLVHVVPNYVPLIPMAPVVPSDLEETGRAIVVRAVEQMTALLPDEPLANTVLHGARVPTLVGAAEGAPMIVLGHEERSTLERLVTGSTVAGVASRAACPVVVVPAAWEPADEKRPVVVGIKSTQHSHGLVRRAFEVASLRGCGVVFVHAWELPQEYDDLITARVDSEEWSRNARRSIEESLPPLREAYPDVPVEVRARHGQPARVLQQATEDADLLLLARRSHAFPFGHLGGTGRTLLRGSHCPVEVLPPADAPVDTGDLVLERSGAMKR